MDIGFVWDDSKYKSVIKKHDIRFYEVVSAFDDQDGYELPDPSEHEERWMWVGRTHWNRVLVIVYTEQDLPLYRIITAFDAEGRWLNVYHQRERI